MPLTGRQYVNLLKDCGLDYFTGVPCSLIRSVLRELQDDPAVTYFPATREDCAVSMAAGAWLGGRQPMVLMQNSGLGNALDVLVSLNATYRIPLLMLVTWRGFEHQDEPQHWLWGDTQNALLDAMGIPFTILDDTLEAQTRAAVADVRSRQGLHVLVLKRWSCIDEAV